MVLTYLYGITCCEQLQMPQILVYDVTMEDDNILLQIVKVLGQISQQRHAIYSCYLIKFIYFRHTSQASHDNENDLTIPFLESNKIP